MKILLVQPPRRYWPYLSYGDNFVLPQWMPCIASVVREAGHEVRCLDCMAEQTGWSTLEKILKEYNPDVIGVSESHAMYINEASRFTKLVKQLLPNVVLIAGGGHYSNLSKEVLLEQPVDFIIIAEGERTIVELLKELENKTVDFKNVHGISYIDKITGKYVKTYPRALVENLDDLPMPAYDLMPMDKYGTSKYLFAPGGITIYHGRGCPVVCDFCVWWVAWAQRTVDEDGEHILKGKWRTKSVKKTVDEIEYLVTNYNKRCFMFVDGTWNVSPKWNREFAEEIIRRDLKIYFFAFMRADLILRDEKMGVLELLVKAGLAHFCIGLEHSDQSVLDGWGKSFHQVSDGEKVVELFAKKYPQVFVQGTFIVGNENESRESIKNLGRYVRSLKLDFPAFHILTPVPGTKVFDDARKAGTLEVVDFSKYDWNTPILKTKYLSREELLWEVFYLYKSCVRFTWLLRGLFSNSQYKRNMYIWWLLVTWNVFYDNLKNRIFNPRMALGLVTPKWYNH